MSAPTGRCTATSFQPGGVYRCVHEAGSNHAEHQYNYYRALTDAERVKWFPAAPTPAEGRAP